MRIRPQSLKFLWRHAGRTYQIYGECDGQVGHPRILPFGWRCLDKTARLAIRIRQLEDNVGGAPRQVNRLEIGQYCGVEFRVDVIEGYRRIE